MVATPKLCINPTEISTPPCTACDGVGTWVACSHGVCPCPGRAYRCEACGGTGVGPWRCIADCDAPVSGPGVMCADCIDARQCPVCGRPDDSGEISCAACRADELCPTDE